MSKAEKYLNKELGFVKNTLISYDEVVKAMEEYYQSRVNSISSDDIILIAFTLLWWYASNSSIETFQYPVLMVLSQCPFKYSSASA
jgi:hypothetical protein